MSCWPVVRLCRLCKATSSLLSCRLRASPSLASMAWRSHGEDNQSLVAILERNGIIKESEVREAMLQVDRANYCQERELAYQDTPQRIGWNITISAPHMHAHALSLLARHLQPGMRGLDVGSGSGYLTVCMALMVGSQGRVVGIDHIQPLVDTSLENMRRDGKAALLDSGQLSMVVGIDHIQPLVDTSLENMRR